MKRILTVVSVLSLVLATGAMALDYGWTLSTSNSDPLVNTGAPLPGTGSIYLWLNCNLVDGAAAFGAHVTATNAAVIAGFTPVSGVLNAGTATDPQLAIGGCPDGPFLVGSFFMVGAAFDMCLENLDLGGGLPRTVDCNQITPTEFDSDVIGLALDTTPCMNAAQECTDATEPASWGQIKGMYR